MAMHRLIIKLKQHTPLIHFQHDQEGATLRASEVKPKLDRFILTELGKSNLDLISDDDYEEVISRCERTIPNFIFDENDETLWPQIYYEIGRFLSKKNGWIKNGEHPSLDYKMRVEGDGRKYEHTLNIINAKKISVFYEHVILTILVHSSDLAKEIKRNISNFFIVTNIGFRQSKGYGSFLVECINDNNRIIDSQDPLIKRNYLEVLKAHFSKIGIINVGPQKHVSIDLKKYFSHKVKLSNCDNNNDRKKKAFREITSLKIDIDQKVFNNDFVFQSFEERIKSAIVLKLRRIDRDCIDIVNYKAEIKQGLNDCLIKLKEIHNDFLYSFFNELIDNKITKKYQWFKSGQNRPYQKSKLRDFSGSLKGDTEIVYWDKRFLKQCINKALIDRGASLELKDNHRDNNSEIRIPDSDEQEYFFIRALLGLEGNFEFQTNDKDRKIVVSVDSPDSEVERFQSIILFKIIGNEIYVCIKSKTELKKMFNKRFDFKMKIKNMQTETEEEYGSLRSISTPIFDDSTIDSLYAAIINHFN